MFRWHILQIQIAIFLICLKLGGRNDGWTAEHFSKVNVCQLYITAHSALLSTITKLLSQTWRLFCNHVCANAGISYSGIKLRALTTRHAERAQIQPSHWLENLKEWRTTCDVINLVDSQGGITVSVDLIRLKDFLGTLRTFTQLAQLA